MCAMLLEKGANACIEDTSGQTKCPTFLHCEIMKLYETLLNEENKVVHFSPGIMGIMRIAATMPTLTREVLDGFVSEDIYQGER